MANKNQNILEEIGRLVNMLDEQQKARLLGFCEGLVLSGVKEKEGDSNENESEETGKTS